MSNYTLIIMVVTTIISYLAFNNGKLRNDLILWPVRMRDPKDYYRLLTHGFIHADWQHLIFNMITLFFFGTMDEQYFKLFGIGKLFPVFYVSAIIASALPSFVKHKQNPYYASLGASGGVSAVLFAGIYYNPWMQINFIIPGILFAIAYVIYSYKMDQRNNDNIGHNAHLWGAVYGFVFAFVTDPTHGRLFLEQIQHPVLFGHQF